MTTGPRIRASSCIARAYLFLLAAMPVCGAASLRAEAQANSTSSAALPETPEPEPQAKPTPKQPDAPANGAQASQQRTLATSDVVRANLEPSYVVYPFGLAGLDPLVFEADIAPHFFVTRPPWPFAFVLTPKIVLRMFREHSAPVNTPSYMPRVSAFVWFQNEQTGKPALYTSLTLSHHSNGQSGPFFNPDHSFNHESGSFSTNYFELSVYGVGFTKRVFAWSNLSLEWHPGFNENRELRGRYGRVRAHAASTVLTGLPWHGTLSVNLTAILDQFQRASPHPFVRQLERFPLSFRYAIEIPGIDLGFYVGYYFGHDYYNIWFDRLINVIQVGVAGRVAPSLIEDED